MAKVSKSTTGITRAVFSDAARDFHRETGIPIATYDHVTGCWLCYDHLDPHEGRLRLTRGPLRDMTLSLYVSALEDINPVAGLVLAGMTAVPTHQGDQAAVDVRARPRAVFSESARTQMLETDRPIMAVDRQTECALSYRFEAHAGGVLRLTNGPLGDAVLAVGCEPDDLNLVATLLIGGIRAQRP